MQGFNPPPLLSGRTIKYTVCVCVFVSDEVGGRREYHSDPSNANPSSKLESSFKILKASTSVLTKVDENRLSHATLGVHSKTLLNFNAVVILRPGCKLVMLKFFMFHKEFVNLNKCVNKKNIFRKIHPTPYSTLYFWYKIFVQKPFCGFQFLFLYLPWSLFVFYLNFVCIFIHFRTFPNDRNLQKKFGFEPLICWGERVLHRGSTIKRTIFFVCLPFTSMRLWLDSSSNLRSSARVLYPANRCLGGCQA